MPQQPTSKYGALTLTGLLLVMVVLQACSSPQKGDDEQQQSELPELPLSDEDPEPEASYEFQPMVIRALEREEGEAPRTAASDIPELFREANDYLRAERCEKANELFSLVKVHATDERYVRAASYNYALCKERMGELETAADAYDEVINRWPATEDGKDAVFRLAEIFARQGEFQLVEPILDRVLGRSDMTVRDSLEAYLRIGFAKLELREFAEAEQALLQVLRRNQFARAAWNPESMTAKQKPVEQNSWILAQAHYGIGRAYHELFGEIRMVLPLDRYEEDLRDKHRLLDEAVDSYVNAIKSGNRYWSPAAGFMSGQIHEDYYFDILASEVPSHFGEQELSIYFEELRAHLKPVLERAISIYQNNLAMAYRLNSDEVWIDATLERIEYLSEYLENETDWSAEHDAIVAGEHPRSASALEHMRFRDEVISDAGQ
jgi:tetratricopeptide (TPR) repeat protein